MKQKSQAKNAKKQKFSTIKGEALAKKQAQTFTAKPLDNDIEANRPNKRKTAHFEDDDISNEEI